MRSEFLPLYAQVQNTLTERLTSGAWAPGDVIPSEIALAKDLGVSQGTVRKAIDRLCADGALTRVQGRGTFVSMQTPEEANFRFFRMTDAKGNRVVPTLLRQMAAPQTADAAQAAALHIDIGADIHVIDRVRNIDNRRAILERIVVSDELMPGLSRELSLPNALYPHYQEKFGISVLSTQEKLSAVPADARQARRLSVPEATPLLRVERVAADLIERPIEYRVSHFVTEGTTFAVELK